MKLQHIIIQKLGQFIDYVPDQDVLQNGIFQMDQLQMKVFELDTSEGSFVVVTTQVCQLTDANQNSVLSLAMSANHCWRGTGGATFSFDPLTQSLHLSRRFNATRVDSMKEHEIGEAFMALYDTAIYWLAVVSQMQAQPSDGLDARTAHALSFGKAGARLQ